MNSIKKSNRRRRPYFLFSRQHQEFIPLINSSSPRWSSSSTISPCRGPGTLFKYFHPQMTAPYHFSPPRYYYYYYYTALHLCSAFSKLVKIFKWRSSIPTEEITSSQGKARLNSLVFRRDLKELMLGAHLTVSGREFQRIGAAYERTPSHRKRQGERESGDGTVRRLVRTKDLKFGWPGTNSREIRSDR